MWVLVVFECNYVIVIITIGKKSIRNMTLRHTLRHKTLSLISNEYN